jgi:hypothetical protein
MLRNIVHCIVEYLKLNQIMPCAFRVFHKIRRFINVSRKTSLHEYRNSLEVGKQLQEPHTEVVHIVAYLLTARTVEPEKQTFLVNGCVIRNNGVTAGSGIYVLCGPYMGDSEDQLSLRQSPETEVTRAGGWCEMQPARQQRNVHCWKTLPSRAAKTVTENTVSNKSSY